MKLLKLFLITMALVGVVALCGCTSSNENATAKTTINGEEVVKTQEVEKSVPPDKVVVDKCNGKIITMDKREYEAIMSGKAPQWYVEKSGVDKFDSVVVVEDVLENRICGHDIVYDCDCDRYFTGIEILWTYDTFKDFCAINGVEPNSEKFKEFLNVIKDSYIWCNESLKCHIVITCPYGGMYMQELDVPVEIYLVKKGWAFISPYRTQYVNGEPTNPYEDKKDEKPFNYKYWQKLIEAQNYAKEHKLGIWGISLK